MWKVKRIFFAELFSSKTEFHHVGVVWSCLFMKPEIS